MVAAVDAGTLDPSRLESYHGLRRELAYERTKADPDAQREAKRDRRRFSRSVRKSAKMQRLRKEGR